MNNRDSGPAATAEPASLEAYRSLLDALPYPAWLQRARDGPILLVNAAALAAYGHDEAAFMALDPAGLAPPAGLPDAPTPRPVAMRHRHGGGGWLDVETSVRPTRVGGEPALLVSARPLASGGAALAELVDALEGIVWEADAGSMSYRYVSPEAERLLGFPLAMWSVPTFWLERIHPADREQALASRAAAAAARRDYTCDYRMIAADGRVLWLHEAVSVASDDAGRVLLRGVSLDVTADKAAEAERARALAELQALVDSIPALVAMVDGEERFRLVNRRYAQWFGGGQWQLAGRRVAEVVGPDAYAEMAPHIRAALAGRPVRHERPMDDLYGEQHWLDARYEPQSGADGRVSGFVMLIFDVSDRRRAEWAVTRLNAELEQRVIERTAELSAALRELEAFSYAVSHDLTAPLRAIDGFSSILLVDYGEALDQAGRGHLLRIRSAAGRMSQLIDDLLNLSRLSRQELRPGPVDLSRLAAEVLAELARDDPERQVSAEVAPELVAQGDAGLLRVVLDNLLGNAWKYTRRQAAPHIRFGRGTWQGRSAYFVADNGIGFDMAHAGKLFGPFQRLHAEREFEGSGIGLATVQRILRRHGGDIWAEAAPDEGATFWFTLGEGAAPIK